MNNSKQEKKEMGIVGATLLTVLFAICFLVFLFTEGPNLFSSNIKDVNDILDSGDEIKKGDYVSIDVDAVVEWYAETKHTINGFIPAGKERHCIVWVDDTTFISLTVKGKKNIEKINDIIADTEKYLYGMTDYLPSPVEFTGEVKHMDSKIEGYYKDALSDLGISTSKYNVYMLTIDSTMTKGKIIGMLLGTLALTALGVFLMIKAINNKKKEKLAQMSVAATPVSDGAYGMDMDYSNNTYDNPYNDTNNYDQ